MPPLHESSESFDWRESAEVVERTLEDHELVLHEKGRHFVSVEELEGQPRVEVFLPEVMPAEERSPAAYIDEWFDELGDHLVILVQAGAAALGWWEDDELLHSKVLKAYVVRGRGRAQTIYAKTKGKSRYGSRLRLQNAQKHLIEINERIHEWWSECGDADKVFYSCPQRMWPELFATRPPPPFDQRDERLAKVPIHVHTPNTDELLRVRRKLTRGRVLRREPE